MSDLENTNPLADETTLPQKDTQPVAEAPAQEAPFPQETTTPATEAPPPEKPATESKARRFFRRLLRGLLTLLIIFGVGFAAALYTVYQPAITSAKQQARELEAQLESAQAQIADLESQISELEAVRTQNDELIAENEQLLAVQGNYELRIAILNARLDVANAILALAGDDPARARLTLDQTSKTLEKMASLLPTDQQEVATSLQQRLSLVIKELDSDAYAAASDLDVLARRLLEVEDALFSAP